MMDATFDIGIMDPDESYVSMEIYERAINFEWEIVVVYGLANHSRSTAFLAELHRKISSATLPVVVGGDFNLIRCVQDKSNGRVNFPGMQLFNDCIADLGLRELDRVGARLTWTNHQADSMMSILDRVFVDPEWELKSLLAFLQDLTRIGSDHAPLLLSSENDRLLLPPRFRFKSFWLNHADFAHAMARQFMKGWGPNLGRNLRERKKSLIDSTQALDLRDDSLGLSPDEWVTRYNLEDQLAVICSDKQAFWRQRGTQHWVLRGDANTAYFQAL
ncbi:hypothetical protein D1007_48945 [Hordeum vulgare]|nr:hypothetical protein D1007_48945 [Hordeum vulgare]